MHNVIIGEGNKGNSAIVVPINGHGECISENKNSYWIFLREPIELNICIFKNTDEGKKLKKLIDDMTPAKELEGHIFKMVLPKADPLVVHAAINIARDDAFDKGMRTKVNQIRDVLSI